MSERPALSMVRELTGHVVQYHWETQPKPSWHERASCVQFDSELFYPDQGYHAAEAKLVCDGCPVQEECLDEALANGEEYGVWGGSTPAERRKMPGFTVKHPEQRRHG